jgi:hypothetical protein
VGANEAGETIDKVHLSGLNPGVRTCDILDGILKGNYCKLVL